MPGTGCRIAKIALGSLVATTTSYSLRKSSNVNDHIVDSQHVVDTASQLGNIWVPITLPQRGRRYLNPVTGERREAPPAGAAVTHEAAVEGYGGKGPEVTYGAPGEQFIPESQRKSCVPHCTWNCTQPVCEQKCEPVCRAGECETRCPKMDASQLEKCHVQCSEPKCSMYCPKGKLCEDGNKTLGCPKCKTRCEEPQCNFVCNNDLGDLCKTVCPDPVCTFKCQDPTSCPKPECKMLCETPPDCGTNPTLPPVGDHLVIKTGQAQHGLAQWVVGVWDKCSTDCGTGTQSRSVVCSSGHDEDCTDAKPANSQKCDDYMGCQYAAGEWGECSARCGAGTRSRKVNCAGARCMGPKPAETEPCTHNDKECTECEVVVYGGPSFDGWSLSFGPGDYTVSDMEVKGAKCDDVSSLKVNGLFCEAHVFEYGDFNVQHKGWQAVFKHGQYDRQGLLTGGAKDNDISSMKVKQTMPSGFNATGMNMPKTGGFDISNPLGENPFSKDNPFANPMNSSWENGRPWSGAWQVSVVGVAAAFFIRL